MNDKRHLQPPTSDCVEQPAGDTKSATPEQAPAQDAQIASLVERLMSHYDGSAIGSHLNSEFLPNRDRVIGIIERVRRIFYPGFFDEQRLTSENIRFHVGNLLNCLKQELYEQVRQALRYQHNLQKATGQSCDTCDEDADRITDAFLDQTPSLRELLLMDVDAAFEGDPAAVSHDETIFCYPGVEAIFIYRIAHALHDLGVPLLPRIMTEYAHETTGVDIHPGARIGKRFFIDHATGVVIGETAIIGDNVKIYQGVTLGAISTRGGQAWRGMRRHPTIEDNVTIYPNATILGGETTVGEGCTINGGVFLIQSVEPGNTVRMRRPELDVQARRVRKPKLKAGDGNDSSPGA